MSKQSEAGALFESHLKGILVHYFADVPLTQEDVPFLKSVGLTQEEVSTLINGTDTSGWLENACSSVHSSYLLAAKRGLLFTKEADMPCLGIIHVTYESGECKFHFSTIADGNNSQRQSYVPPNLKDAKHIGDKDLVSLLVAEVSKSKSVQEVERLRTDYHQTAPPLNAFGYLEKVGGAALVEGLKKELIEAYKSLLARLATQRATFEFANFGRFEPKDGLYTFFADVDLTDYLSASFEIMELDQDKSKNI